jgi:hypothetical protein
MRSTLATTNHVEFGYFLFVLALAIYVWITTRQPLRESAGSAMALKNTAVWRPSGAYALVLIVLASIPALVAIVTPSGIHPAIADDRGTSLAQQTATTDRRS